MAEAHHLAESRAPQAAAWEFCKEMSNWGPLIPGYVKHEVLDDVRSLWSFQIDLGPFSKLVLMDVTITERVELERVKFEIKGRTESFYGDGQFGARENGSGIQLFFDISVTPTGPMGRIVDALARPVLPKVTQGFASELVRSIEVSAGLAEPAAPARPGRLSRLCRLACAPFRALLRLVFRPFARARERGPE